MTEAEKERAAIVAWLRRENTICDCFAHEEGECACGVWWESDKEWPLTQVADAIERGDHIAAAEGSIVIPMDPEAAEGEG